MLKRCRNCHIFMPPRSFHCRSCDCCVREFDHHCHWIGNCIGIRNHFYFLCFLFCLEIVILCGLVLSVWLFVNSLDYSYIQFKGINFNFVLSFSWPAFLFILCTILVFSPITGLLFYHIGIISRNLTTHEDISLPPSYARRRYKIPHAVMYPFDHGFCRNWLHVLSGIRISSQYKRFVK